jgi:hypothetical protein
VIRLWCEPGEDGFYSVDDLSAILGPDTARLVPLLRNLGVSLSGPGASLLPFRHLPPSEAGILLLEMCSALVAGESYHTTAMYKAML